MAKKRLTQAQKEKLEKEALRRRIADIAIGAAGYDFDTTEEFATADFLSRFIPALKVLFLKERKDGEHTYSNEHLFDIMSLDRYDNIDTTTDYLFANGIRANS